MPEMQLMEYDFDDIDATPAVPQMHNGPGSKKKAKNNNNNNKQQGRQNEEVKTRQLDNVQPRPSVQPGPDAPASPVVPANVPQPAEITSNLLEQVTEAFSLLPDAINDTNAIARVLTGMMPMKKGTAALIVGIGAGIVAYYCLSTKGA